MRLVAAFKISFLTPCIWIAYTQRKKPAKGIVRVLDTASTRMNEALAHTVDEGPLASNILISTSNHAQIFKEVFGLWMNIVIPLLVLPGLRIGLRVAPEIKQLHWHVLSL